MDSLNLWLFNAYEIQPPLDLPTRALSFNLHVSFLYFQGHCLAFIYIKFIWNSTTIFEYSSKWQASLAHNVFSIFSLILQYNIWTQWVWQKLRSQFLILLHWQLYILFSYRCNHWEWLSIAKIYIWFLDFLLISVARHNYCCLSIKTQWDEHYQIAGVTVTSIFVCPATVSQIALNIWNCPPGV